MSNSYNWPVLPTSDSKLVTIVVDGVEAQVPEGTNLVEALKTIGIETPHFCYHPDLPVAGNCRQCMVETEGPRGMALSIACYTPVRAGMKVATDKSSDKVRTARKAVMEFQLANHPLDCPICDKAGECTLQENYMAADRQPSRMREEIGKRYKGSPDHRHLDSKGQDRGGKHVDLGPAVVLDEERCILCDRCVRFMRDVAGSEQLYIASRGDHSFISTFPDQPLDHEYDLNVTDVCPVGALTGKHFRFQQRVWLLGKTETVDPTDGLGANITVEHHDGHAWRIMPRRNPEVNKSWIANSSRLAYLRLSEDRLTAGLFGRSEVPLAQAVSRLGELVRGARKVALVASGHLTLEDNAALLAWAQILGPRAEVFGGSWLWVGSPDGIARSGDPVPNRNGLKLLGIPDSLDELRARVGEFDVLVVVGNDLWTANASKAASLEKIPERIALSSWSDATVQASTLAIGIRAWAEVRGTMVNVAGRIQLLNAAPILPSPDLEPAWQVLSAAGKLGWTSELDAFRFAQSRIPSLVGLTYRTIGPQGRNLAGAAT
ncbi:MAG TPA: 2Fe-2S iron-sulfur cluster-binding protein [Fibrobacteria bacterium]|nr:2Fe-2S iron-sulfur cluster-binding protein [Fibrobacteria bacterium]